MILCELSAKVKVKSRATPRVEAFVFEESVGDVHCHFYLQQII
jgi:hypothetical protein